MSFNNNYLVDEIFQEKNQFLKDCLKELIDNRLLYIFKKKENYFLSRISKNSDEEFKKDKYLYIREIFINLDYFIACFKFNLLEIPKCLFCGNPKKLKTKDFLATCGKKECVDKKRKLFNLEKYGSACNLQNPLIKEKSIKTMRERYGVDNASKSMQLLEKKRLNNLHKYGVDFPLQLNSIKEKIKETNLKKYGVSNAAKNEEIKKKIEFTNRKNHVREEPDSFKAMKRIIKEDKLYKEKHKIALENNVVILKSDDEELNNCMRYCENKYNDKKWYIQFKKSS